jgi:3-carboxy-cis,cis-muconate cycloisomerase
MGEAGVIGVFGHPWLGRLFGDPEAEALWSGPVQIGHFLAFEAAYTRAAGKAGLVAADMAEAAARAIEGSTPDLPRLAEATARDGVPIPELVRQLREAAGPAAAAVHSGATSQDVMDTALSLTLAAVADLVLERLSGLGARLADLERDFGSNRLMGRTRMQAALPIRVADRIAAWRLPLEEHAGRVRALRPRVALVQLGGPVGTGVAPDGRAAVVTKGVAEALGLAAPERAWHARRDGVADFAGALSLISGTLGKLGQDVCLMAQQGIDAVVLTGGGASSAMRHKQNPILAELLVTLARFNATQVAGMHHAVIHEQERSGAAWALEWMILPAMTVATCRGLTAARELVDRIEGMGEAGTPP